MAPSELCIYKTNKTVVTNTDPSCYITSLPTNHSLCFTKDNPGHPGCRERKGNEWENAVLLHRNNKINTWCVSVGSPGRGVWGAEAEGR